MPPVWHNLPPRRVTPGFRSGVTRFSCVRRVLPGGVPGCFPGAPGVRACSCSPVYANSQVYAKGSRARRPGGGAEPGSGRVPAPGGVRRDLARGPRVDLRTARSGRRAVRCGPVGGPPALRHGPVCLPVLRHGPVCCLPVLHVRTGPAGRSGRFGVVRRLVRFSGSVGRFGRAVPFGGSVGRINRRPTAQRDVSAGVVPGGPGVEATVHGHVCAVFRHRAHAGAVPVTDACPGLPRLGQAIAATGYRDRRPPGHRPPGTGPPATGALGHGSPAGRHPGPGHAAASKPVSWASFFSSSSACFSICRMRSRVRPCSLPTSVSVRSRPSSMP